MLCRNVPVLFVFLGAFYVGFGCSSESDSSSDSDTSAETLEISDNFPNFYELSKEVAPSVTSSSEINSSAIETGLWLANFDPSYETDDDAFASAFSLGENLIGQVFNDAGVSGPVKSIYVLLAGAQSTLDRINEIETISESAESTDDSEDDESEDSDEGYGCVKITESELDSPFFDTATNGAFNSWDDGGKYTCGITEDGSILVFGSHAIESPSDDCEEEDAYEFYVMEGYSSDDAENTEQVSTRGSTVDGASIKKFYYNGCSGDLKVMYAQTTLYSAGVEFSSRTELTGNTADHSFTLRASFIDADTSYATHNTFVGHGVSKKASDSDDDAHFIIGYRSDDCGNSDDSSSCTLGTATTFCAQNAGTGVDFSRAAASGCSDYEETYEGIEVLKRSDLPSGFFDVSGTSIGL